MDKEGVEEYISYRIEEKSKGCVANIKTLEELKMLHLSSNHIYE